MKNGVPWDVAMEMDSEMRAACAIVIGTIDGGEFSWSRGRFMEKRQ